MISYKAKLENDIPVILKTHELQVVLSLKNNANKNQSDMQEKIIEICLLSVAVNNLFLDCRAPSSGTSVPRGEPGKSPTSFFGIPIDDLTIRTNLRQIKHSLII